MTPFAGAQYPGDPDLADAGERSSRPAFEGRLSARWGDTHLARAGPTSRSATAAERSASACTTAGWRCGDAPLQNSNAVTADGRISFTPRVELRGECTRAAWCAASAAAAIDQAFGKPIGTEPLGPPINDQAGWAQLNAQFLATLLGGAGCGLDVVDLADRPVRTRNTVCAAYLLWRPSEPFFVGLE